MKIQCVKVIMSPCVPVSVFILCSSLEWLSQQWHLEVKVGTQIQSLHTYCAVMRVVSMFWCDSLQVSEQVAEMSNTHFECSSSSLPDEEEDLNLFEHRCLGELIFMLSMPVLFSVHLILSILVCAHMSIFSYASMCPHQCPVGGMKYMQQWTLESGILFFLLMLISSCRYASYWSLMNLMMGCQLDHSKDKSSEWTRRGWKREETYRC